MKKRPDVDALAASLSTAAAKPLQEAPAKKSKVEVKQVFLRLPLDLFEQLDAQAVAQTKATGRGVSIQQVIIDKLRGGE